MRPPRPRRPRRQLRNWNIVITTSTIPATRFRVKAKTRSEARARVKQRTGLTRLPVGTVIAGAHARAPRKDGGTHA